MKLIRSFILCSVLLIYGLQSFAQFTIQLYPANELTLAARDLWNCMLTNGTNAPFNVYLKGTVAEQSNGLIYDVFSAPFILEPGIRYFNTTNADVLKPETVVFQSDSYIDYLTRTNSLPRGTYTFCVYLIDAGQQNILAEDCFEATVSIATPPMVINPVVGDSLCMNNPFFIWSPPQPPLSGPDVSYTIRLFELTEHQTPVAAVLQNPVWFTESNIPTPIYQYSIVGRPFELDKTYAWYVLAYEGKTSVAQSDIGYFTFNDCSIFDSIEVEPAIPQAQVTRFLLQTPSEAKAVVVLTNDLHFTYISKLSSGSALMRIIDDSGTVLHEKDISVLPGYNFLSAMQSEWNFIPGKAYTMHVLDRNGELSALQFWYQPTINN